MRFPIALGTCALLAAALAACGLSAATREASPSPRGSTESPPVRSAPLSVNALTGRIAYSYEGDIYTMNADGSGIQQLTSDPAMDFDPAWSPDGARLAFRSHRDGNEEVYLMLADGSDQHNLSNSPSGGDYSPAWSPDGQWIAFMSDRAGKADVWVVRPDGSEARQVTDLRGISEYPTWSPDGRWIAFHCTQGRVLSGGTGDFEICVIANDGTGFAQLTDAPGESKLPAWSPDGRLIAFQSNREGWPTLPDYVPLGYDAGQFGDFEIYLMSSDGSGQRNLTHHPEADDTFPAWSRAGLLVFSRYGCLMVTGPDDSSPVQISEGACTGRDSGQFPDWYQPAD
jgi:Tol biopolymer transport system component